MPALSSLTPGQSAFIKGFRLEEDLAQRLMHMGVIPGGLVECVHRSPAGDPTVYRMDGLEIALRRETAQQIEIEQAEAA